MSQKNLQIETHEFLHKVQELLDVISATKETLTSLEIKAKALGYFIRYEQQEMEEDK